MATPSDVVKSIADIVRAYQEDDKRRQLSKFEQTSVQKALNFTANLLPEQLSPENIKETMSTLENILMDTTEVPKFYAGSARKIAEEISTNSINRATQELLQNPQRTVRNFLRASVVENQNLYDNGEISYTQALTNINESTESIKKYLTGEELLSAKKEAIGSMHSYAIMYSLDDFERATINEQTIQFLPQEYIPTPPIPQPNQEQLNDAISKIANGDTPSQSMLKHPSLLNAYQITQEVIHLRPSSLEHELAQIKQRIAKKLDIDEDLTTEEMSKKIALKLSENPEDLSALGLAMRYNTISQRLNALRFQYEESSADAALKQGRIPRINYNLSNPNSVLEMFYELDKSFNQIWYQDKIGSSYMPKEYYNAFLNHLDNQDPKKSFAELGTLASIQTTQHAKAAFLRQLSKSDPKYAIAYYCSITFPDISLSEINIIVSDYMAPRDEIKKKPDKNEKKISVALNANPEIAKIISTAYDKSKSMKDRLYKMIKKSGYTALLEDKNMVEKIKQTALKDFSLIKQLDYRGNPNARYYWSSGQLLLKQEELIDEVSSKQKTLLNHITLVNSKNMGYHIMIDGTDQMLVDENGTPLEFFFEKYKQIIGSQK